MLCSFDDILELCYSHILAHYQHERFSRDISNAPRYRKNRYSENRYSENLTDQKHARVKNDPAKHFSQALRKGFINQADTRRDLGALPHSVLIPIAATIRAVSERYTNRTTNAIQALSAEEVIAYVAYYLPINFEKFRVLIPATVPSFTKSSPLAVLDFGSGPGTAALALATIRETPFSLTAIEANAEMRHAASALLSPLLQHKKISSLEIYPEITDARGSFDLIIAGHVLNELPFDVMIEKLIALTRLLHPKGSLLILETALKPATHALMSARDEILRHVPELQVHFPCTHNTPCPMRTFDSNDWCHGALHWNRPRIVQQLDELTGFNKHELKYSALVLSRMPREVGVKSYRVVAPPHQDKTGHTQTLCGQDFYGISRLSKRERSESNLMFRRAELYDLLVTPSEQGLHNDIKAVDHIERRRIRDA